MKLIPPTPSISEVRDSVVERIRRSGVMPGGRIPTEREFQEMLGVSRSRIRDAMAALESQGVVKRLVGSGTYLEPVPVLDGADEAPLSGASAAGDSSISTLSPSQLIEARIAFEVSLSSVVVRNATNYDLEQLEHVLEASERAQSEEEYEKLDSEFHHLIAVASHNQILIQFSHLICEGRLAAGWRRLKQRSATHDSRNGYQSDHRRILCALQDRSSEAAASAIRDHLVAIHHAVLKI